MRRMLRRAHTAAPPRRPRTSQRRMELPPSSRSNEGTCALVGDSRRSADLPNGLRPRSSRIAVRAPPLRRIRRVTGSRALHRLFRPQQQRQVQNRVERLQAQQPHDPRQHRSCAKTGSEAFTTIPPLAIVGSLKVVWETGDPVDVLEAWEASEKGLACRRFITILNTGVNAQRKRVPWPRK
jgi:hypothetical protein